MRCQVNWLMAKLIIAAGNNTMFAVLFALVLPVLVFLGSLWLVRQREISSDDDSHGKTRRSALSGHRGGSDSRADLRVAVVGGTMSYINVTSSVGGLELIAQARVVGSSEIVDDFGIRQFITRPLKANLPSEFELASTAALEDSPLWTVKLRGEGRAIHTWTGCEIGSWFDERWDFHLESDGNPYAIKTVWTRVTLVDRRGTLVAAVSDDPAGFPHHETTKLKVGDLELPKKHPQA